MMPTFLIIGAMKSGTTALYDLVAQHPEVYVTPVKEPNFFAFAESPPDFNGPLDTSKRGINRTSITNSEAYRALYDDAEPSQERGEASHTTLYWPDGARNVERFVPDARLVAILRNPIDRAYSEYMHFVRDGDEPVNDFEEALDAEPHRIEAGWAFGRYVDRGRYAEQLQRFKERFANDQLHVILHEDLICYWYGDHRDVFAFIGVDPSFELDVERRVNASGVPRSRVVHRLLTSLQPIREALTPVLPETVVDWANRLKNANLDKPGMKPQTRDRLRRTVEPEIRALEPMIGRDLSGWLGEGVRV